LKRYKRIYAALLAGCLLLSLAACGGGEAPPESPSSPASQEEEAPEAAPILGEFTATDLAGNEVTQSVFEGHPVTMVNVWATFCGPCLREMPDLGALHQEFSEQGFQILGIVTDVQAPDGSISQEQVDLAAQIAEETGASYLHLLPSEDLIACLLWQVSSVPTTIFVDETGALIGKGYLGSRDAAAWRSIIEEKLEAVSAGEDAK
jgi:thiol-disulfide isomerase/thioredoxin